MKTTLALSTKLNKHLEVLEAEFHKEAVPLGDSVLFAEVRKATDPIFDMLEEWEEKAAALIKARKLTVHPQQIVATKENYEMLLMHSYFRDIRRRKYMDTKKSCHYILEQIIEEFKHVEKAT